MHACVAFVFVNLTCIWIEADFLFVSFFFTKSNIFACYQLQNMYAQDALGENSDNLATETRWCYTSVILGPDMALRQRKGLEHLGCFSWVLWGGREGSQGEESRGGQGDWLSGGIRSESGGWTQTWPRTSSQPAPIKYINRLFQRALPAGLLYHFHMCV